MCGRDFFLKYYSLTMQMITLLTILFCGYPAERVLRKVPDQSFFSMTFLWFPIV